MSRFTLRDLFWLTLVVACLTAWWVDHREFVRKYRSLYISSLREQADERKYSEKLSGKILDLESILDKRLPDWRSE